MHDERDLERLLDCALSSYGDPGPESGLEQRILARVINSRSLAELKRATPRLWPWFLALPAVCCLILLAVLPRAPEQKLDLSRLAPQPPRPAATANGIGPSQPLRPRQVRSARVAAKPQLTQSPTPPAKLDVFPTPRPLNAQEQALVTVASRTPRPQRQSLLEATKTSDAPLSIAAIRIDPLEMPDEGKD
jgi:hypothetical protein